MKFKIGDRVTVKGTYHKISLRNKTGTVLERHHQPFIDFGEDVGGHDCEGRCPDGNGWAVPQDYLTLAKKKQIQMVNK